MLSGRVTSRSNSLEHRREKLYFQCMEPDEPNQDSDEINYEELLKTSTLPADLHMKVSGPFSSEAEARELSDTALAFLRLFGTFLNLEGLDGVTIADDYSGALAEIDRGFQTSKAPSPTRDGSGYGFAMSLPVIRDGVLKTHIVLECQPLRPLVDAYNPLYKAAVHALCHEAAHSHDHLIQSRAFPGLYGTQVPDYRDGRLLNLAIFCWDEYIASRLSAPWGTPDYCKRYEDGICSILETAPERGNAAIMEFYSHRNIDRTVAELEGIYGAVLTRASYLVGHVHGLEKTFGEAAPRLFDQIEQTAWFKPMFDGYTSNILELYETYGQWSGVEVLEPLKSSFEALLNAGGMFFRKRPDGRYTVDLRLPIL